VLALVLLAGLAATAAERDVLLAVDVKDAPATQIIQALAETAGLQVVFDPGLSCRLTLKFNAATYDRAFESVLRACRFDYEGEGNVIRVASITRLSQEASERRRLAEAQREAAPRREVRLRLLRPGGGDGDAPEAGPLAPGRGRLRRTHQHAHHHRLGTTLAPARDNGLSCWHCKSFIYRY
jgi:hypothetical protein